MTVKVRLAPAVMGSRTDQAVSVAKRKASRASGARTYVPIYDQECAMCERLFTPAANEELCRRCRA